MQKLKSALHHWWPRCVSKHWADAGGFTHWLTPDGGCKRVPPAKLGQIGNGHHIKLSCESESGSPWDESFESEFDSADSKFPALIEWLNDLNYWEITKESFREGCIAKECTEEQLLGLTECVVSLVVRSPCNREAAVSLAESFRGKIASAERNAIIGLNMKRSQRMIADCIGVRAKFAVLFSSGKEFIYGDGLYSNVAGLVNAPTNPTMLVPITPLISVVIFRPSRFCPDPRLSVINLSDDEVEVCNRAVQVYSKNALFYRTQRPPIAEEFARSEHLIYSGLDSPVDQILYRIPGVFPRDRSLDFLYGPQ